MSDDIKDIGARIRELREISDYTRQAVADELGIDTELYENYEENGENIPIGTLYRLAHMFGVSMSVLLTGSEPRIDTFCVVPAGKGVTVDRFPGYNYEGLAYNFKDRIMEPMIVTVDPHDGDPELVVHRGQEMNYVLEGKVEVIFDSKRILLEEGDTIYFNPTLPHGQKAAGGMPAKFLTVITE